MLSPINSEVHAFSVAVETVLTSIRMVRPDLDLIPLHEWVNAQAQVSTEHGPLHYLEVAYRTMVRGEPLPWQTEQ